MAGHSKWANIKHRKAAKDARKGQAFARYSREIIVAAKMGGGDPAGNFRLRTAIDKAKAVGIPNDNIQRAIEKGAGTGAADNLETVVYEGYGPGGVAVMIETMTDNRNRTAGDIRSYFNKYEGNLGSDGCVAWIFEQRGLIQIDPAACPVQSDALVNAIIEAGAEDFTPNEESGLIDVMTSPADMNAVCQALADQKIPVVSAEWTRIPQNSAPVTELAVARPLMKLLDALENHDDVQAVYANVEMDDALLDEADG
ncbi:MAG: YebC/PmpR family DNA-binding transcriptional regulator [Candidatus Melainabacteria bacterium]